MGQISEVNIRSITEDDIEGVLAIDRKIAGRDRAVTYTTVPNNYVGGEMDVSVVATVDGGIRHSLFQILDVVNLRVSL